LNVYEIELKLFLLKEVRQEEALNQIAAFIDETLSMEESLLKFHQINCFKNYVFCSLYPMACQGVYKKDRVYTVIIRTIHSKLSNFFCGHLAAHRDASMQGLTCNVKIIPKRPIEKVYSLTPVILKDKEGYWKKYLSFEDFESRLKINLIKKYNAFMNDKVEEDFQLYTTISLLNEKPIKIPYKGIHLLGDKIELQVSNNPLAQRLSYMMLGTGAGESNARGCGFMNYQWCKEG